jgi:hypothetical protein
MAINAKIVRVAASTSGGTQDITISGFGTPKAAIITVQISASDGKTNTIIFSHGATDGTRQWVASINHNSQAATTSNTRYHNSDRLIYLNSGNTVKGVAYFSAWITDGIRINWTTAPDTAYLMTVELYGGDDLSARVDTKDGVTNITDVGFEPDLVRTACIGGAPADSRLGELICTLGAAWNQATDVERCLGWSSLNGQSTSKVCALFSEQKSSAQLYNDAISWSADITDFDADGFTFSGAGGGDDISFIALKFANHSMWLGTVDTPTGTGNQAVTAPGFTPQLVIMFQSMITAVNTLKTDSTANAFGIGGFDVTRQYGNTLSVADNAATAEAASFAQTKPVYVDDLTGGGVNLEASFVSLDATGYTLNWTTVNATARKFFVIAIEESSASGPTTYEVDTTFSRTASVSQSGGAIAGGAVTLAKNNSQADGGAASAASALALDKTNTITQAGIVSAISNIILAQNKAVSVSGAAIGGGNLTLASTKNQSESGSATAYASTTFQMIKGIQQSTGSVFDAALSLGKVLSETHQLNQTLNMSLSLGKVLSFAGTGAATALAAITQAINKSIETTGSAVTNGGSIFGKIIYHNTSGGSLVESELSLGKTAGYASSAATEYGASVSFAKSNAITIVRNTVEYAGITLSRSAFFSSTAQVIAEAAFSLGISVSIMLVGDTISATFTTHDNRTYTISAEYRVYNVNLDDRTYTVQLENRTFTA